MARSADSYRSNRRSKTFRQGRERREDLRIDRAAREFEANEKLQAEIEAQVAAEIAAHQQQQERSIAEERALTEIAAVQVEKPKRTRKVAVVGDDAGETPKPARKRTPKVKVEDMTGAAA